MKKSIWLICSSLLFTVYNKAEDIPGLVRRTAGNYTYMWWINSVKEQKPLKFAVKTANYSFVFNYENLQFENFSITDGKSADKSFLTSIENIMKPAEKPSLEFGIETDGKSHPCKVSSLRTEDCQLIHSGRFLQHRFINRIPELPGCDPHHSGLDVIAWSDRLSLDFRIAPVVNLRSKAICISFIVPEGYVETEDAGNRKSFKNIEGKGYLFLPAYKDSEITAEGNRVTVRYTSRENIQAGEKIRVGLIIYPLEDIDRDLHQRVVAEENPPEIIAVQKEPVNADIDVRYDAVMGWHRLSLRNDVSGIPEKDNDHIEKVTFIIKNDKTHPVPVRLNFSKEKEVFSITGISSMIRDMEGNPTGIPVQLSKNWHTIDFNQYENHLYRGKWYHGLTVIEIPPQSSVTLEYVGVNAHWGNVPAASHAQLCLVGWGQNQLWDQSAIGSWGESICYEPDLDQASAPVLDMRPLLVSGPEGEKWQWTGNVGGVDFLNMKKTDGQRAWHTGMRAMYKRYSPNLTEVVYAGIMDDGKAGIQYTTSIGRSDDITRGIFRIRMDVVKDIVFSDLAIFQLNAEYYHYGISRKLHTGNENGLVRTWNTVEGEKQSRVVSKKEPLQGNNPWIAFTSSSFAGDQLSLYRPADRGFTLREWNVCIGGEKNIIPHWQEYYTAEGNHGKPSSIINLTLPEGITSLSAGDYIETEVEVFILPVSVEDYYGSNENLRSALKKNAGTWKIFQREATGNHIILSVNEGNAVSSYPVVVNADNNKAGFSIKGGIGYVPLTITGLTSYRNPKLFMKEKGKWKEIDQSRYGKDFWQTDYNTAAGRWEITYNIKLDSSGDRVEEREFKFGLIE
ncbi:MAG: hypothetical protein LBJ72_04450 [Dysgonamonadaceae bacterium]|jgi:hypothetical protein|nr:hypothetical protein [Dysgonamonadaceae bacterium]